MNEVVFDHDAIPLFVMGAPRSGTTLLHQLLNAHKEIYLTDEMRVFAWLFAEADKIDAGFKKHGNPYPFIFGKELARYLRNNAASIIRPFYVTEARQASKRDIRFWGDKYPHYDEYLEQLAKSFPRARYVMIHRELSDVICSAMSGHGWDVDRAASYVATIYGRYIRKLERLVEERPERSAHFVHVSYEKLVEDTNGMMGKVLGRLGLVGDPDYWKEVERLRNLQSHSLRVDVTAAGIAHDASQQSIARWKRDLSPAQVQVVENTLAGITPAIATGQRWCDELLAA